MSTLALPVHNLARQRSVSDKFARSASPTIAMNRQRSTSGQRIDTDNTIEQSPPGSLLSLPHYTQHQHHLLSSSSSIMSDHHKPSFKSLSPYDHPSYSQSSDSLVHSLPTRKISSSNFIRMARQASDTAFRSVGLNRKGSDHNLREQHSSTAFSNSGDGGDGGGVVYEQNPKVYLFQQQQQQQQQHQHIKTRRPYCDDAVPGNWAINNKLLHTESGMSDDPYYDHSQPQLPALRKPFALKSLRRNVSMPDLKNAAAASAGAAGAGGALGQSSSSCEPHPSRATSPQPSQINRSRSRPRVHPQHFIATTNEPTAIVVITPRESTLLKDANITPGSSGDERALATQRTPSRPPRNQNHHSDHKLYQQHQNLIEQQRHHEQQRQRLITRHQVLSDESLPEYGDAVILLSNPSFESANANFNTNSSKDLPPTPPGPPPSFSLPTRSQRRRNESSNSESELVVTTMPVISDALSRKGSNKGIIPQDVLRSMDPKDVQKAVSSTVIASRVYKMLDPEQLESLKKEQEGLHQFVEAMNVSLHIETRMRDASHSLIRLHETNLNLDAVKGATSQLHTTNIKMDQIVQKSQQAMWRLLAIQRLLLQHESAVLNAGLRRLDNENRDLSRSVMNLETARGQEKEEKLRWKKEHTRLKVQSIMFLPTSPNFANMGADTDKALPPTPNPQIQVVQEQLSAMEKYAKELSEDILQKDEKLGELRDELGAVRGWAGDFEVSIQSKKECPGTATTNEVTLQEQLNRLQSTVEAEYKDVQVHADELQNKVHLLTEENLALVAEAAAATSCQKCMSSDSTTAGSVPPTLSEQQQERQARRSWRIRQNSSSSTSTSPSSGSSALDLHSVLRESLWELDRQIQLDERHHSSSSLALSISTSSNSSSSCRNSSASSASSTFSIDNLPSSISRRSSTRSTTSSGRLSRASSNSSASGKVVGLREQVLMRDMTASPEMVVLLSQVVECEGDSDAEEEGVVV